MSEAPGGAPIVRASGLQKRFTEGSGASRIDVTVLHGVDLAVARGETVAVVGASGSGKSTLLHLLGGLEAPTRGSVELAGRDFAGMGAAEQGEWRNRHLGFVYQFHHLLPEFTALDNVAMPLRIRRVAIAPARERASVALGQVGLGERLWHRPSQLSGGERQRVAIARALVNNPSILLADEPTGNLDSKTGVEIMGVFERLHKAGNTIVLVTHEPDVAAYAYRSIHIRDGQVEHDVKRAA